METASSEVDALEAELHSLEQQLSVEETREPDKPMEVVQRLLAVMLAQLKDNPFIPPEQVNMATTHVQELIAGFENTVKAAKQEDERAKNAVTEPVAMRRCTTKRPEDAGPTMEPLPQAVRLRLDCKAPEKKLVVNQFRAGKREIVRPTPYGSRHRSRSTASL